MPEISVRVSFRASLARLPHSTIELSSGILQTEIINTVFPYPVYSCGGFVTRIASIEVAAQKKGGSTAPSQDIVEVCKYGGSTLVCLRAGTLAFAALCAL